MSQFDRFQPPNATDEIRRCVICGAECEGEACGECKADANEDGET